VNDAAERPVRVARGGGELVGVRGGEGPPALVLHGGPCIPDYTGNCAAELRGLLHMVRYTQRGVSPSTVGPPYAVEDHLGDAVAVLDALGIERAWLVGHSWGGHLALHLLVTRPERVAGVIAVGPLGIDAEMAAGLGANLRRGLTEPERDRLDELERLRREGDATEADLLERWELIWPRYFALPERAPASPTEHIGVDCSRETNASIAGHLRAGTLRSRLPSARAPVLLVHGTEDPMPIAGSAEIARLVPGARLVPIDGCGHFPWLELPGELRRAVGGFLADA
jgi:pimeloyl-ACP methyl ester carboxylesterase